MQKRQSDIVQSGNRKLHQQCLNLSFHVLGPLYGLSDLNLVSELDVLGKGLVKTLLKVGVAQWVFATQVQQIFVKPHSAELDLNMKSCGSWVRDHTFVDIDDLPSERGVGHFPRTIETGQSHNVEQQEQLHLRPLQNGNITQ